MRAGLCRETDRYWDVPVSEQALIQCTTPAVETRADETVEGPQQVSWAAKPGYSACQGSDPILAWLDMGPETDGRVARSSMPYIAATAKKPQQHCKQPNGVKFRVRQYNGLGSDVDSDYGLSIFSLPANNIVLIKQAIYSSGTISAGFSVYDGETSCHVALDRR